MHLSFIMKMGLPKRFFDPEDIVGRARDVEHALAKASEADEDVVRNRVVGRFAAGYTIPDAVTLTSPPKITSFDKSVDVLVDIRKLRVSDDKPTGNRSLFARMEDSESKPGYTRLRVENADLSPTLSKGHDSVLFDESSGKYFVSSKFHRSNLSAKEVAEDKESSLDESEQYTYNHVVAFPCITWPKVAEEWVSRVRNTEWMSELLAESIASKGCHVIPIPHPNSSAPDIEWSISFATAELAIAREAVTTEQRRCFVFFLIFMRQLFEEGNSLDFYHYQTIFLYACETLPLELWEDNPGHCLLHMINSLVKSLKEHHLAHYFIPEWNLFEHKECEKLKSLQNAVESLQKDPSSVFLTFSDQHVFGFQCSHTPFRVLMEPILDDMRNFTTDEEIMESVQSVFSRTLFGVAHMLVEENTNKKLFEAVNYLIELYPFFAKCDPALTSLSSFLDVFGQQLDSVTHAKNFYEEALRRSKTFPELRNVRGNLACLCHAVSYNFELGTDERRELLCKAESLFRDHFKTRTAPVASTIDYINFLYKQKRFQDVISLSQSFLTEHIDEDTNQNAFGNLEINALDDNLRREVIVNGFICAPSATFAFYFAIQSYVKAEDGNSPCATSLLQEFEDFCSTRTSAVSHVLLGYCHMGVSQWQDALRCFNHAVEIQSDYIVDQNVLDECKNKA